MNFDFFKIKTYSPQRQVFQTGRLPFYFLADNGDTRFLSGKQRHSRLLTSPHLFRSCSVLTSRQGMCGWTMRSLLARKGAGLARSLATTSRTVHRFHLLAQVSKSRQGSSITSGSSTDSFFISGQLTASSHPLCHFTGTQRQRKTIGLSLKAVNGLPF